MLPRAVDPSLHHLAKVERLEAISRDEICERVPRCEMLVRVFACEWFDDASGRGEVETLCG